MKVITFLGCSLDVGELYTLYTVDPGIFLGIKEGIKSYHRSRDVL